MWCPTCQRDTSPEESGGAQSRAHCGSCGTTLGASKERDQSTANAATRSSAKLEVPDDWALEADVRAVHRLVENLKSTSRIDLTTPVPQPHRAVRVDEAHDNFERTSPAEPPPANLAAWLLLSLGLATFACGAVLLGWSFATDREDLWPLGMPLALAGQAALIVGLVLQLDGLWRTSRKTEATLTALDGEISKVRQATTLLSSSHSGPSQSFYLHMAEGAPPQLLLADLKGQLDLLAQQMRK